MLVLSRKKEEKIVFEIDGEKIELTVVRIDSKQVRLGIDASKRVTVLRHELLERQPESKKPTPVA